MKKKRKAKPNKGQTPGRKRTRPDFATEEGIARRWAEGRGQGEGADYRGWLRVPEFSSKGYRTMTLSAKFGPRVIHLFSTLEWLIFLLLEANGEVVALKEQFPLDRDETRVLARALGIRRHPKAYGTDVVMTSDFIVEARRLDGSTVTRAIAVKYLKDLRKRRVVEKLEIERAYHTARGHEFVVMTERDLPRDLLRNWTFVRAMLRPESMSGISDETIAAADEFMRPLLGLKSWGELVTQCDTRLAFAPGTAALIARHHIATRAWPVDLSYPLLSRTPFKLLHP